MKRELKLLLGASGMLNLAAGMFIPIYAIFVEHIGGDVIAAGISYGIMAIVAGVLMFFISKWEDRVKHQEKLIIFAYFMFSVAYIGYLMVDSILHFYMVQGIVGIAIAVGDPAFSGVYSRNLDEGKFASEWGTWASMVMIVSALAAFVGGYIVNSYGFTIMFTGMAGLAMISFLFSLLLLKGD